MGLVSGAGQLIMLIIHLSMMWLIEVIFPISKIELAEDFESSSYIANPGKFGNHCFDVNDCTPKSQPNK